ncbi:MAG TPA: T9SS type A sorting domain-containing protein [Cytophagales bacterium]|nr:T9SS type A sorting domain-containing protein [Cytophagales bacterium]
MKTTFVHLSLLLSLGVAAKDSHQNSQCMFTNSKSFSRAAFKLQDQVEPQLDSIHMYYWNETLQTYDTVFVKLTAPHKSSDPTFAYISYYETLGIRIPLQKSELEYNNNGSIKNAVTFSWEGTTWEKSYKEEYTYDLSGNNIVKASFSWEGTEWVARSKEEYTYNSEGFMTQHNKSLWLDRWVYTNRTVYELDAQNRELKQTSYLWSIIQNTWETEVKTETTYDDEGLSSLSITHIWDTNANQWVIDEKKQSYFDSQERSTSDTSYVWDAALGQHVYAYRSTYSYVPEGRATTLDYAYNNETKSWLLVTGNVLYYNQDVAFEEDQKMESAITLYPNPATDALYLNIPKQGSYRIYDYSGHLVLSSDAPEIDISALPQGLYVLKTYVNEQLITKKFSKN